jgi:hypothetical protein
MAEMLLAKSWARRSPRSERGSDEGFSELSDTRNV